MAKKLWDKKLNLLLDQEKEFDFPSFLFEARTLMGISRPIVARDTGIAARKILEYEYGRFSLMPSDEHLNALTELYDLPSGLLKRKAQEYCDHKREKREARKSKTCYATFREIYPEFCPYAANGSKLIALGV